jgi:hypothetical protein
MVLSQREIKGEATALCPFKMYLELIYDIVLRDLTGLFFISGK